VALLKTIGMTRRDVVTVFAVEYALTGAVAAVVGISRGVLAGVGGADAPHGPRLGAATPGTGGALAATVALSVVAGLVASARALAAKPLEVLRSE
jgi:putative ABC transport system permease protein